MTYTSRFDHAVHFASSMHRKQTRKGTDVPYITHLLGVAAIVGDSGGTESQVIAALLHDVVEDQVENHPNIVNEIQERFGKDVLDMVLACSDTVTHPKPPWKERKSTYIKHIQDADDNDPALLISLADKFYNGLTLLRDAKLEGPALFDRFKATPQQSAWYYQALAEAFASKHWPTPTQKALSDHYSTLSQELGKLFSSW